MLNPENLEKQLLNAFTQYFPIAFEEALRTTMPMNTEMGNEMCKKFGQTVSDMLAEPMASSIAAAIDYYVKNGSVTGTIVTSGTPISQQAVILPATPITAGIAPNTFKIV